MAGDPIWQVTLRSTVMGVYDVVVTAQSSLSGSLDSVWPVYVNYVDKSSSPTTGRVSLHELKDLVSRISAQPDTLQQEFNVCCCLYLV